MNRKIGLFDSGLGGLSILKEMLKEMPNEDYLFYEDSINFIVGLYHILYAWTSIFCIIFQFLSLYPLLLHLILL